MKVKIRKTSPEVQDRLRHRLQVSINELRREVGWGWDLMNDHCIESFGRISSEMTNRELFRLMKDLYELRKFQAWQLKRGRVTTPLPSEST